MADPASYGDLLRLIALSLPALALLLVAFSNLRELFEIESLNLGIVLVLGSVSFMGLAAIFSITPFASGFGGSPLRVYIVFFGLIAALMCITVASGIAAFSVFYENIL
ncbi:hypothetical protein [Halolamina salina]|uniref:Uncharacterized protein n=1 Tax=Halolamina salina TaxID=1220023 RepID=A0ABD6BA54_9EURY